MIRSDLVGHIMTNQRTNYQLTAITLGMILLGGTILGSTPFAFADDDDDKTEELKAKFKKLLEKIKAKIKDRSDNGSCKGNHYGDICDNKRPSVGIKKPDSGDKLQAGDITFEIKAKDKQTGIKMVELSINRGPFLPVPLVSGDKYQLVVELNEPGRYQAKAIATDNAGNTASSRVSFKIV